MNGLHFVTFAICVAVCMAGQCSGPKDKRVYTFGVGIYAPPHSLLNDKGDLIGFSLDIIRRVCEKACKKCEFIAFNDNKMCWDPDTMQGIGKFTQSLCAGWVGTKQRELVYKLLAPFANERPDALFVRQNSNIRTFDPDHHKVGLLQSYRADERCLKVKKGWEVKNVTLFSNYRELHDKVLDGTVDVGFGDEEGAMLLGVMRKISDSISCATKGHSLMMRKDMVPVYAWFPPVLEGVMASGYYRWICNLAKPAYGGNPHCIGTA